MWVKVPLVEKTGLSSLNCLCNFVESQLTIHVWFYFWTTYFISLIYVISYFFDNSLWLCRNSFYLSTKLLNLPVFAFLLNYEWRAGSESDASLHLQDCLAQRFKTEQLRYVKYIWFQITFCLYSYHHSLVCWRTKLSWQAGQKENYNALVEE